MEKLEGFSEHCGHRKMLHSFILNSLLTPNFLFLFFLLFFFFFGCWRSLCVLFWGQPCGSCHFLPPCDELNGRDLLSLKRSLVFSAFSSFRIQGCRRRTQVARPLFRQKGFLLGC